MKILDPEFVRQIEASYFRTDEDIGANTNALMIWNHVREHVGLPRIGTADLPSHCLTHDRYHVIKPDYGCIRTKDERP